ncbi:helix-turn-helix transcriptional regulator [Ciceribacter sp. L1K23]|uniref:TetR/AcrR family transcriptional regulator n=1 Tax=Ciceribacter sp. L1K23 TaxID=2820276 RepID=UPI001B83293A|nr:TetR/AcrR family transcriptional regulator [Ciceribacter sp. L1K23]MBR0554406.1 helix-turn-helix transcriptional regulator [Ciceribacter sp. L1K23]
MTETTAARIIAAAETLFYEHGLRSVGVDAIAERAGVTKRTLYNHFQSKDALITAYLEARDSATVERYRTWLGGPTRPLPERVEAMFAALAEHARNPRWRGCGFTRAAVELAGQPGHPAVLMAARHKKRFVAWLEQELGAGGASDPRTLALHLAMMIEGAIAYMLIHGDTSYALSAGEAAASLVASDMNGPRLHAARAAYLPQVD